tara:strand:+ start:7 stop:435 length:429 start_codon:yes stop_codon:yes gene_type:complete
LVLSLRIKNKKISQYLAIGFGFPFVWIGFQHFLDPDWFVPIVPSVFDDPYFVVYFSGALEILFGFSIMIPRWRKISGYLLALLLLILYWANLNMWINNIPINGVHFTFSQHVGRLFIQLLLILFSLFIACSSPSMHSFNNRE